MQNQVPDAKGGSTPSSRSEECSDSSSTPSLSAVGGPVGERSGARESVGDRDLSERRHLLRRPRRLVCPWCFWWFVLLLPLLGLQLAPRSLRECAEKFRKLVDSS